MRTTALVLLLVMLFTPNPSYADDIVIKKGTEVLLKVIEKLKSGEVKKGAIIEFLVEKAVTDENGFVLIRDDASAYGTVTKSRKAGMMGTSGELEIALEKVEAFNGKDIPLRGSQDDKGTSSTGAVVAGALLVSVFAVLFRGSNAVIPANTILRAYVDKTTVLSADTLLAPAPAQARTQTQAQARVQTQARTQNNPAVPADDYLGITVSAEKTKKGGFTVLEVLPGGLSDLAGLKKGDVLTKIDTYDLKGFDIEKVASYVDLRLKQKAVVKATILRGGKTKVVEFR
jgi:hypothetical protein